MIRKYLNKIKLLKNTRFLVRNLEYKFILSAVKQKKVSIVVDIGSGVSPYRKYIDCDRYVCVDIENRLGKNMEVIIADINNGIPLEDKFADLIICTEVLEHIKEPKYVIDELKRVLKEGGN